MRIVGLTGGIACGKSLVTSELLDRGIPVLDCDLIARIVVEPNTVCREQIVFAFKEDLLAMGEEIELPDGSLNRKALGKLVFADEQKRQLLTKITGTGIFNYLLSRFVWHFLRGTPMLVVDAPTLYESKFLLQFCSEIIVVAVNPELQLERLLIRDKDLSREDALNRINSQIPIGEKVTRTPHVIWNEGTREDTKLKVAEVFDKQIQTSNSLAYRLFSGPGVMAAATVVTAWWFNSKL